jgi:ABC-type spermidine/putrescine transport system permease subunit I
MLVIFFLIPLAMLIAFSFYHHPPGGFYEPALTLENYVRFFTKALYLKRLAFTVEISALTAILSLLLGYPFTYYLTRIASRKRFYIILVISTLWLSYIIRSYAWTVILSKHAGISKLFAWVGFIEQTRSYTPGLFAVIIGLVYVFLPFMVLTLYGTLKGINIRRGLVEFGGRPLEDVRKRHAPPLKGWYYFRSAAGFHSHPGSLCGALDPG